MDNAIIEEVQRNMVATLGAKAWNKLQLETKTDVVTSEVCFQNFKEIGVGFDFSSTINPIMKGLENELKVNFYDGYIHYLRQYYDTRKYVQSIWKYNYPGDKDAATYRLKILRYHDNKLSFQTYTDEFTIGNFAPTISFRIGIQYFIDKPFKDYCKKVLFSDYKVQDTDLEEWIKDLIVDIESLRRLRNESSHAGKIQIKQDAETALNDLVKVKKILGNIVSPPWDI